ncbi:MAG: SH3 domain-containing protein [Chloroflexia bacterium]|nr:SH3 domain-containing protein [Chloroflexia bacterium]
MIQQLHRHSGERRKSRVGLLLVVLLVELGTVALPGLASVSTRTAAAITETRVRAEPTSLAEPLLRLPVGAIVTVHGKPENGWYVVRRGELEGYVLTGDLATDAAPALAALDPFDADAALDAPTADAALDAGAAPEFIEQAQGVRGSRREGRQAQNAESGSTAEVMAATDVNLRQSPSLEDPVQTVVPRHVEVAPTGAQSNGYVEVTWDGQTGWVLGRHLTAVRPATAKLDRDPTTWRRRELIAIIYDAADRYGQSREDMLRVARCESDLVPSAVNRPGGSYGLFQFKPGTWLGTPFAEYDIFDPRANANAAAWMWSVGRRREWVCQ